jgi:hypothetical protein
VVTNPDIPQNIAKELEHAIDALEITVNKIDDLEIPGQIMHQHLISAIEEVYGPDVDPEYELQELLAFLVLSAKLLRTKLE